MGTAKKMFLSHATTQRIVHIGPQKPNTPKMRSEFKRSYKKTCSPTKVDKKNLLEIYLKPKNNPLGPQQPKRAPNLVKFGSMNKREHGI